MNPLADIFEPEPFQWGLRGDPFMWQKLKSELLSMDRKFTQEDFNFALEETFNQLIETKGKRRSETVVWFEEFPQHGLSRGNIHLPWWEYTGLPLLKERFAERMTE